MHCFVLLLLLSLGYAHREYLADCPGLNQTYFQRWGQGAVGHNGGVGGATLIPFGESFRDALKSTSCFSTQLDDDDDDHHHHHGETWDTKLCCEDSDGDGLTNGAELGDPCCEWRKGNQLPWLGYNVSHPGMSTEQTFERRVCNGTTQHRKPPCDPYPPSPAPPSPSPPSPSTHECQPAKSCNVCTACCKAYIQDGAECNQCVKAECSGYLAYAQGLNARHILANSKSWTLTNTFVDADVIWVRNRCILGSYSGRRGQAVNYLAADKVITDKVRLAALLDSIPTTKGVLYPQTLPLTNSNDLTHASALLLQSNDSADWILKPADMSRGQGVRRLRDPLAWLQGSEAESMIKSKRPHVLQRFVSKPLLVDGFKTEARLYFVVASVKPLKVLWYSEGSVRFAMKRYLPATYDDPLAYIINTARGKQVLGEEAYAKFAATNPRKWSYDQMRSYLASKANYTATTPDPWAQVVGKMRDTVANVLLEATLSLQSGQTKSSTQSHPFALLGADFLLDTSLQPWLTEIQEGPGLSHIGEKVKQDFVPDMVLGAALLAARAANRLARDPQDSLIGIAKGTQFLHLI